MYNNSSPYHSKSQNIFSSSASGSFSATKLTQFGAESTSPLSPYKSKNAPSSATKASYLSDYKSLPLNKEGIETEIKDHIKALKEMRTELGKQKSFILSQMDPKQKSFTTTHAKSYLNYPDFKSKSPVNFTAATSANPVERSYLTNDWVKRSAENPLKANHEIQSNYTSNELRRTEPFEGQKSKKFETVYNEIMGNAARVKESNIFKERSTYDPKDRSQYNSIKIETNPSTGGFKQYVRSATMEGSSLHKSTDFSGNRFDISSILKTEVPKSLSIKNSINLSKDERFSNKSNNSSSIYTRKQTTPEMSPRYNLLQKEISSRYQRTKEMLDKVVFRSGSADQEDSSVFYERARTEPIEDHVIRTTPNEERPRMALTKGIPLSDEDRNENKISRNIYYEEQPKKQGPSGRYDEREDVKFNQQEQERINEYQKIIEELQGKIKELEGVHLTRSSYIEVVKEVDEHSQESPLKSRISEEGGSPNIKTLSPENENDKLAYYRERVHELTKRVDSYEKENNEMRTSLKNQENKIRLNQGFMKKNEEERERLEKEKENFEKIVKERNNRINQLDIRIREIEAEQKKENGENNNLKQKVKELQKSLEEKNQLVNTLENDSNELKALKEKEIEHKKFREEFQKNEKTIKENEQKINNLTSELQNLTSVKNSLEVQKEELAKAKQLISNIKDIPNDKEEGGFISQLETLIIKYETSQQGLTQEKEKAKLLKSKSIEEAQILELKVKEVKEEKLSKEEEINKLKEKLQKTETQLSDITKELENKVSKIEEEKSSLYEQIHIIASDQGKLDKEINNLTNKGLITVGEKLVKLQKEIAQLKEGDSSNLKTIEDLKENNKVLNEEVMQNKGKTVETENEVKSLKQSKDLIKTEFEAKLNALEEEKSKDKKQIEELLQKINTLESSSSQSLNEQINNFNKEKGNLENELKSLQTENGNLLEELKNLKESARIHEENLEKERERIEKDHFQQKELEKRIAELEAEKQELEQKTKENKKALDKSRKEQNNREKELQAAKEAAEEQKNILEREAEQRKARIETLEGDLDQIRKKFEGEIQTLSQDKKNLEHQIGELKEKEGINQAKFSQELEKLQANIKSIQEENSKLKQEIQIKLEKAQEKTPEPENKKHKQELLKKDKLIKELETKLQTLTQEREEQSLKRNEFEQEIASKEKQIEGLRFDIKQMKNFILHHHNETLLGQVDNDEEQKSEVTSEVRFPIPISEASFNQDISFKESEWETASKKESPVSTRARNTKRSILEGYTEYVVDSPVVRTKAVSAKDKKQKEKDDTIHSKYENIIKDLTERMAKNEKNFKKEIETRLLESNKQHIEKEELLLLEIENLKKDNKALVKKIEDIEWEKAYEYTDKMKKETGENQSMQPVKGEQTQANAADAEAKKKKKKKKKKAKTNAKENDEVESD